MGKKETKGMHHYAWVILIGCCCCAAGSFGAIFNVISVYLLPVTQSLNIGIGDWMLWTSVFSIASCIMLPMWGKWMQTKNFNLVTTIAALLTIVPVFMFAFGRNALWYWIWGGVMGCGFTAIATLMIPTLMGNWIDSSRRGLFLGIATAFTGVGTFVWAPVFTQLVQSFGWSASYIINGILCCLLILPFTCFFFKLKPADKELEPYGAKSVCVQETEKRVSAPTVTGFTKAEALRSTSFYVMALMVFCISIGSGFNSNMVAMATNLTSGMLAAKEAATVGAWMVSIAAVGNIVSKIAFGAAIDRLGVKATFSIFFAMFLGAFVLWMLVPEIPVLLVAAFLFGTHNGMVSVGFPLLTRTLYGNREYSQIYSTLMTVNALMGGFSATIIGYVYQIMGSYAAALVAACLLVAIAVVCFILVMRSARKTRDRQIA